LSVALRCIACDACLDGRQPTREKIILGSALSIEILRMLVINIFVLEQYFYSDPYQIFRSPSIGSCESVGLSDLTSVRSICLPNPALGCFCLPVELLHASSTTGIKYGWTVQLYLAPRLHLHQLTQCFEAPHALLLKALALARARHPCPSLAAPHPSFTHALLLFCTACCAGGVGWGRRADLLHTCRSASHRERHRPEPAALAAGGHNLLHRQRPG
jgi:hypothetical protein